MRKNAWVAIRKATDSGEEWMDTETLHVFPETVASKVEETNKQIPKWAKAHPVVRIVPVTIVETVVEG